MLLLQQMIVMFLYMLIGYETCKRGVLDEYVSDKISWLVINIANPALTISAVVNGEGKIAGQSLLLTVKLAVFIFAGLLLLAQIMPRIFRIRKEETGIYKAMTAFNNIGFMGYPVIAAVYGNEALLYAAIFSLFFSILIYTYGIQIISESGKEGIQWKKILNVGVISCIIAIILYLGNIPVPQFVKTAASGLSGLTGPLSMIVIGISLTKISLKEMFTDVQMLLYALVKLLVIPVAGMLVICRFVDNEMLCGVCMIMLATPAASMNVMLAQQYGRNSEVAAKGVALTTVLSVVTIPLVSAIVF